MTYEELLKIANEHNYTVVKTDRFITLENNEEEWGSDYNNVNTIGILTQTPNDLLVNLSYQTPKCLSLLKACIAFAETPLDEREMEIKYIIPLPHLKTTDGQQQYLTYNRSFFASRRDKSLRQTWEEEHLQHVPKEYRKYAIRMSEDEK